MARRREIVFALKDLDKKDRDFLLARIRKIEGAGNLDEDTIKIVAYEKFNHKFREVDKAYHRLEVFNERHSPYYKNARATASEIARVLGITRLTLKRWDESGEFGFTRSYHGNNSRFYYNYDNVAKQMKKYLEKN